MTDETTETTGSTTDVPARLAPFLAQWDYMREVLDERLQGLTDEEYLWEPAGSTWSVRAGPDGMAVADSENWNSTGEGSPPRTLAWSIGHLGAGVGQRADWLTGSHSKSAADFVWPLTAAEGIDIMRASLDEWRNGLATMADVDLDTVGRSAYPDGLDTQLPLIEIVWWVNKELLFHAGEIWLMRDLYAATRSTPS